MSKRTPSDDHRFLTAQESVKEYYGRVLKTSADLQTSACCPTGGLPNYLQKTLQKIHPEVKERFYGCGSPLPADLWGKTVLDLGCGTGRDCFLLSSLVGPQGKVLGIDMTAEQIAIGQKYLAYHADQFQYQQSNVEFRQGYIEDLAALGIEDGTIDVVVSNCVINLSPCKDKVFSEIFRVLRPGGELLFSDIFADRRIPTALTQDPVLLGECLSGALYMEDFRRMLMQIGCRDYRVVSSSPVQIHQEEIRRKTGLTQFFSLTIRAFKLDLEDRCEDYGQVGTYLGTIPEFPHAFTLDDHHVFEAHRPMLICGNTAAMLSQTRYAPHFQVMGNQEIHFGLFPCGPQGRDLGTGKGDGALGACC